MYPKLSSKIDHVYWRHHDVSITKRSADTPTMITMQKIKLEAKSDPNDWNLYSEKGVAIW